MEQNMSSLTTVNNISNCFGLHKLLFFILISMMSACDSGSNLSPEEHIAKARVHMENREIMEAVIELKNAIQADANQPEARWLLGECYLKLGEGGLAHREFSSAQALGYENDELENNLLRALNKQGKFQEVLDRTSGIDDSDDANTSILIIRGNAYQLMKELDEAEKIFKQVIKLDPESTEGYLGLARVEFGSNNSAAATEHLDKALDLDVENDEIWTLKGVSELINSSIEAAEQSFTKAVSLAPYNVNAYIGLVRTQLALGKKEEAKKHLAIIQKYNKNIPILRYFKAYLEYQENDLEAAKLLLLELIRIIPEHPEGILLLSNILYQEGNLEQVIEHLSKFNSQFPFHIPAAKLLAISYVSQNDADKAIPVLEKIRAKSPQDAQMLALLGSAYLRTGEFEKGTAYLEKASEIAPETAEIKTQLALGHLASGSTGQAINELETALDINPNLYSADILLVMTHVREGDYKSAIEASQAMINKDPDDPLPYNLMGSVYMGKGEGDLARENFHAALNIDPEFKPARFNLATMALKQGNVEEAEKEYKQILKNDSTNQQALIALAKLAGEANDQEKMFEYLSRAREASADDLETRIYLIRYHEKAGDYTKMLEIASELEALAPDNPDVQLNIARAFRFNKMSNKAEQILNNLLKSYPGTVSILNELAAVYYLDQRQQQAIELYQQVLEQDAANKQALQNLFSIYLEGSEFDLAAPVLNDIGKFYPETYMDYRARADFQFARKNYDEAILHYKSAHEKEPNQQLLFRLVESYKLSGKAVESEKLLDEWLTNHPDDLEARYTAASIYEENGQTDKAMTLYEKTLLEKNDDVVALNNLAWLYFREGKPKAREYAEKANQLAPDVPEIMDTLGWILAHDNQLEKAIGLLKTAWNKRPDIPSIGYHLAFVLNKSGDKTKAKGILEDVLKAHPEFPEREMAEKLRKRL